MHQERGEKGRRLAEKKATLKQPELPQEKDACYGALTKPGCTYSYLPGKIAGQEIDTSHFGVQPLGLKVLG